jgi:epoxyqueuosine reductase
MSPEEIKEKALSLGFDDAGITPAIIPDEDIRAYQRWLAANKHANLAYMENQIRCNPENLLPGAKTAIIFVTYYKQPNPGFKPGRGLIASYARGRDYHNVHRKRLKHFIRWLEEKTGQKNIAKGFSDSAPILERALAVQAGLGWFGKNTLLIHRQFGTYTLLSGLLTTLHIPGVKKQERMPRCGSCTRCLDACPTEALSPYELDAAKCLSYHLIESKQALPNNITEKNPGYVFGCDICQEACPHNFRKSSSQAEEFRPDQGIGPYLDLSLLEDIEASPEKLFGTPLNRRGVPGLKHSMKKILGKDRLQS